MARFLSLQESTSNYSYQFTSGPRVYRTTLFSALYTVITEKNTYSTLTLKYRLKNWDDPTRKRSRRKHIHQLFVFCIDSNGLFAASIPNSICRAPYHLPEACVFCCFSTSPVTLICFFPLLPRSSRLEKHPLRLHQAPAHSQPVLLSPHAYA